VKDAANTWMVEHDLLIELSLFATTQGTGTNKQTPS
jgi:hypothetical protein